MKSKSRNNASQRGHYTYETTGSKKRRPIIIMLFILMIIIVVAYFYISFTFNNLKNSYANLVTEEPATTQQTNRVAADQIAQQQPISLLLVGINEDDGRLVGEQASLVSVFVLDPRVSNQNQTILARDIQVTPPGSQSQTSLGELYVTGSLQTKQELTHQLLNVPIDYTIEVKLSKLRTLIDKLGGLDVSPNKAVQLEDRTLAAGQRYTLTSREVMLYMQARDGEANVDQSLRQLDILYALVHALSQWGSVTGLHQDFALLVEAVQTNLPFDQIVALGQKGYLNGLTSPTNRLVNSFENGQQLSISQQLNQLLESTKE